MKMAQQNGLALVMVLFVVAIVTIAMVSMASRQQVDIRRAGNLLDQDRAYLLALGGEDWGRGILSRDGKDNQTDHLGEDWAVVLPAIPVEGGAIGGVLEDMQGRFNINNLLAEDGTVVDLELKRFERLLSLLDLDPEVAEAVLDWMDVDTDVRFPEGAEDDYYMTQVPPYRAANRRLASSSELVMVKGFGYENYQKIEPYVSALPETTAVNVNTASDLVLASLADGLGQLEGESLLSARGEEGFDQVSEFLDLPELDGSGLDETGLAVSTHYFLAKANAEYGRVHLQLFSLLLRDQDNKVKVLARAQGAY